MVIGRITRVDGLRAAAVFFERMQPHLVSRGTATSSPRINSFVETSVGFDKVVCQIVGEHEAEYDKRNEVNQGEHVIPDGGFVVDLEVRGHITGGKFLGGLRCLPIVGATVETIEDKNLELLYSSNGSKPMPIGHSLFDETQTVYLDMGKLIASHIGIFGNTGSGKSNTLACIMNKYLRNVPKGSNKARVVIFDLNNEYGGDAVIAAGSKKIYRLNTRRQCGGDRIPIDLNKLDVDSWGTILRATQKTQMPVVRRAFRRWKEYSADNMVDEIKQSLLDKRNVLFFTLRMEEIKNMNFFKKKNSQTNSKLTKPDIEKLLQEAYQANPKCYEKEDGTLLIGLALTEDTDSLFPIVPEEQWAIEGKTISEWIITMVSLTNPQGGIIGQMEYHEAIKRLEPFILMKKDNWALIRAMTHEELDSLFGNLPRKLY